MLLNRFAEEKTISGMGYLWSFNGKNNPKGKEAYLSIKGKNGQIHRTSFIINHRKKWGINLVPTEE
jgi:hypothetical protein